MIIRCLDWEVHKVSGNLVDLVWLLQSPEHHRALRHPSKSRDIMALKNLLSAVSLFAGSALAEGSLSNECTDLYLSHAGSKWPNWLVGKCLTGSGNERVESAINLDNRITNDNATMKVCSLAASAPSHYLSD